MADFQDLVDAFGFLVDEVFERKSKPTRGLLGDGAGNVDVPGRDGFSYVRPHRGDTRVIQIFNKMVTASDGTPVIIGEIPWLPGMQQILGVDWETYMTVGWDNRLSGLASHARSHERRDFFVGEDAVNVYTRMLFPLRAEAVGSGTTSVTLNPYELSYKGGIRTWPGSPGLDLSPAIPAAAGQARWALVYWDYQDTATPYGSLGVASGTLAPISTSTYPPKPAAPAGTIPSAYVYLFYDQTAIKDEHIKEARLPIIHAPDASVDAFQVSKLVSPDGLIDPVLAADNNGDLTAENDLTVGATARGNIYANWHGRTLLSETTTGVQYTDNDSSYPAIYTEVSAPQLTNTNELYGFWYLQNNLATGSYKYRFQTDMDGNINVNLTIGPIMFRDGGYTADIDYYFGTYRDSSGIDETRYNRVHLQWDSATPQWRIRGEWDDGGGASLSTWKVFGEPLHQPFWIRIRQVLTAGNVQFRTYYGTEKPGRTHSLFQDLSISSASVTWGDVWFQVHQTRGAGIQDYLYIGGHDSENVA